MGQMYQEVINSETYVLDSRPRVIITLDVSQKGYDIGRVLMWKRCYRKCTN